MDSANLIGTDVGGWRLEEVIGQGRDGVVFAARQGDRCAAIKIYFPDQLAKSDPTAARERLDLQLALVGSKHHPNLVEIYGGGELPALKTLYLAMELIPGKSLDKLLGQIPHAAIVPLAGQLAAAAQCLERMELVHRDIKPANVMISDDFAVLTLLDLGIIHQLAPDDEGGRLSGPEFVSTLRYSPHEFVWRAEEAELDEAWLAVTYYQIGATLHDMIMGKVLFDGNDKPRACLYDAVRYLTPPVENSDVDAWLLETVKACLLKDWRQRLKLLSWPQFSPPVAIDVQQQEMRIRVQQVRRLEARQAELMKSTQQPKSARPQELWALNSILISQLRNYVLDTPIFPKCSINEAMVTELEYKTLFRFESDDSLNFPAGITFAVTVSVDPVIHEATKLSLHATRDLGKDAKYHEIAAFSWTEMFTVESAFQACRQSFLNVVETIVAT